MVKTIKYFYCLLFGHYQPYRQLILPSYFAGIDGITGERILRTPIQPKGGFWQCQRCGKLLGSAKNA